MLSNIFNHFISQWTTYVSLLLYLPVKSLCVRASLSVYVVPVAQLCGPSCKKNEQVCFTGIDMTVRFLVACKRLHRLTDLIGNQGRCKNKEVNARYACICTDLYIQPHNLHMLYCTTLSVNTVRRNIKLHLYLTLIYPNIHSFNNVLQQYRNLNYTCVYMI